jgi:hypothetical protein
MDSRYFAETTIMKLKITIACILLLIVRVKAQAPKYSNEFLSIGIGARALGMGGAQAASVSDATSAFWNPAGLLSIKSNVQVAAMHSEYFAGIAKFDYGTICARPDATRAMAFSVIRFGVDDIPDTSELLDGSGNIDYSRLKSFSAADYAFLFSYAFRTKVEGLQLGANAKIIHRKVGDFAKAWGFGLDAGAQYQKGKWIFGAMAKDISSTFNAWSFTLSDELKQVYAVTNNDIPENSMEVTLPKLILGTGYKTNIGSSKFTWLGELDGDITFDGQRNVLLKSKTVSADPHLGMEVGYDDFIFARGGVNNVQEVKNLEGKTSKVFQPNFGIGIRLKNLYIDYALSKTNFGEGSDLYSNIFSLKLDIYKHAKTDSKPINNTQKE